ncbi:PREDICTED: E3 ubiquitin-protein ligase MARCH4-like [Cariama cristata]|uniref:E3 ubiquitin-protein ligase MARCH4-like n=1 Tax=Cariama cristata TaxID=54380 RepID=UPI0005202172|nr:PREDICTED: E3 ubiquitin-protein ligase MARCH4-like [Cariama cristata]
MAAFAQLGDISPQSAPGSGDEGSSCVSSREPLTDSSPAGIRAALSVIHYCQRCYVLTAAIDGTAKERQVSEGQEGELLSPCRCDGSVKCTHQPCLIKWISERGCWSCELCYYKYHVIAISTKNPLQWQAISLTVIEKVQIAAAILGSLFLIASISWLIWSTFSPSAKWQRQDLLFQICYGMYGFMDIVCIGLIIHEGPSVYRIFKRWQAVNQQWKVLNYDKTKDMEEQKTGTRTNQRPSSQTTHSSSTGGTATNSAPADSGARAAGHATGTLSDHHCAYTILHILSHLRPHEQRSQSSSNRELVMRVTTV